MFVFRSPAFEAMFAQNFQEKTGNVRVEGCSAQALQSLILYLHTDELGVITIRVRARAWPSPNMYFLSCRLYSSNNDCRASTLQSIVMQLKVACCTAVHVLIE